MYVDISVGRGYEIRKVSETQQKEMSKKMDRAIGHMWHEQHGGYCGEKATEKSQGWWGRREDRRLDKNNYFDMPDLKMQIQKKCAGTYI